MFTPTSLNNTCRDWSNHTTSATETDDTAEENDTQGLGRFSHGAVCLSHQQWVQQGGSFGVHCTEGPEASHKKSMRLAALRVRHFRDNVTHDSMIQYLCYHNVFQEMVRQGFATSHITRPYNFKPVKDSVRVPLQTILRGARARCSFSSVKMGSNLDDPGVQSQFLHPEARIARFELLDLVCQTLNMPTTRPSYRLLERLDWFFGHKLVNSVGDVYWATDTQYTAYGPDETRRKRRDIVQLSGTEPVQVGTDPNRNPLHKSTALCAQLICFFTISGIREHGVQVPVELRNDLCQDRLTFALGRWFSPHPQATDRDSEHRPICPGPLNFNHCLWKFAIRPRDRRALIQPQGVPSRAFNNQRHIFGAGEPQQQLCLQRERRAYFCIFTPSTIIERMNMTEEFDTNTTNRNGVWLQTVTIV